MIKRFILMLAAVATVGNVAYARKVTGSVTCGGAKLQGVIVTDGKSFTQTNGRGKFSFDIADDAEHVYIVTPSGYVADWSSGVPAFYMEAPGCSRFDFKLEKTASGNDYSIIAIADPQTYSDEHFAMFSGAPMNDLCKTAQELEGTVVGLSLGDISWDRIEILDMYKKEIVRTGVPFYPVVGNHDNTAWYKGDLEGSTLYRAKMGPENYAFFLGKDVVIVLDNIIYDTEFKSTSGYTDHVIEWVRGLLPYVPAGAELYIAQHAPTVRGRDGAKKIYQANRLLDLVRGRKVTILSGHTHVNNNIIIEKNITEHNVAAICGAWWENDHCADGTPRGYKVFTKSGGMLSWYYKPVDSSRKHIAELSMPGENLRHPSCVVVNVWDWDPSWKVEWYEDGVFKGAMDPVRGHCFTAQLARTAGRVTVSVKGRFGQKWVQTVDVKGLELPEEYFQAVDDSLDNVKAAIDRGVNTLKFDLHVDMQGEVRAAGKDGILLSELLDKVDAYTRQKGLSPRWFTFRFMTENGAQEGKTVPYYHDYVDYCMDVLWPRFLGDRLTVDCPDVRAARHLAERYPEVFQLK